MQLALTRVQVPNFGVLKNVDLQFSTTSVPRIYPIAGANGCGKSLLLELIFCLLTCSYQQPNRRVFLENVLNLKESNVTEDGTIAKIQLDFDGRSLDLHYSAIKAKNLTPIERNRVGQAFSFGRYQLESIPTGIYPIMFASDEYLLVCSFGWTEPLAGEPDIDAQHLAQIFNQIGRRVFLVSRASDLPRMLCGPKTVDPGDYAEILEFLHISLSNFFNLDRTLGWWRYEEDPRFCSEVLTRLHHFLEANQGLEESIVLLDGIDVGLDADSQYQVTNDLLAISARNQYLVATHSFELCQALTPAHVREL